MGRRGGGPKCRNGINEFIGAVDCEFENVATEVTRSTAPTAAVLNGGPRRNR